MNKSYFLVGVACLFFSGAAFGQFKLVDDTGKPLDDSHAYAALSIYLADCLKHSNNPSTPEPKAAIFIKEGTGKATPINCATAQKLRGARKAKKIQETPKKPSVDRNWEVLTQKKDGSWRSSQKMPSEDRARDYAAWDCLSWRSPIRIVDTASGKEYAVYCDPKTGKLIDGDKPPPVVLLTEPEASERAKEAWRQCRSNAFMNAVLDCGCIEKKAKAELLQSEARVHVGAILKKVSNPPIGNECVSRKGAYAFVYDPCVSVMKSGHPHDAERICSCSADATAAGFVKDPTFNLYHFHRLRDAALKQCRPGKKAR